MPKSVGIKGQDILLLVKLLSLREQHELRDDHVCGDPSSKSFRDLSWELAMSASEVHAAERRLMETGLVAPKRRIRRQPVEDFLLHGFRYVFPARPGELALGVPTGRAAPPLAKIRTLLLDSAEDRDLVWASESGTIRGQTIVPIYGSVPEAALRDETLYLWLALLDCLRAGRTRDQGFASREIRSRLRHERS